MTDGAERFEVPVGGGGLAVWRWGRDGPVAIAAHGDGGAIEITVDDDGPGVPAARRDDVFRPFFRLDPARNPLTGGVGLGLAVARDIVHGHGGDITLGEAPQGGLRGRLRLPGYRTIRSGRHGP